MGQRDKALSKALFWLGCSAVAELAQAGLQLDVAFAGSLPPGPKIFAANHPTTMDPFLLLALTDEPMSILVTGDVFKIPLFGRYLRAAGHIPVVKTNGRPAFDRALALLRAGRSVGIFPEGQLSPVLELVQPAVRAQSQDSQSAFRTGPEGRLSPMVEPARCAMDTEIGIARARNGAARLALGSGAAVVPVGIHLPSDNIRHIEGKIDKTPGFARLVLRGPYAMTVGDPLHLSGDPEDRGLVCSLSEMIMDRIAALRHQSRRRLAAQRKREIPYIPKGLGGIVPLSPLLAADGLPTMWGREKRRH